MKFLGYILVILLFMISIAIPAEEYSLRGLDGKYPWERVNSNSPNFINLPSIKNSFDRLVPEKYKKKILKNYAVGTPNRIIDDYLVMSSCKRNCCPCENYIALAEISEPDIYFIIYDSKIGKDDLESTHCFSANISLKKLPSSLKEEILLMHNAKMNDKDMLYPKNKWLDDVVCQQK
jgi:hypothetical protein